MTLAPAWRRDSGLSLLDTLVTLALIGLAAVAAVPAAAGLRVARVEAGARDVAASCAAMRWRAISEARYHGLWFVQDGNGWTWWRVADGNGNGLRTAELRDGTDQRIDGPFRLEFRLEHVRVGLPNRTLPRIPPESGSLGDPSDPIRTGPSDIVSFAPNGGTTTGTIYVTDDRDAVAGIRLYGATGRARLWTYRFAEGRWRR